MKITKIIEIGDYKFELNLESKSVHAYSLMTDYKEILNCDMKDLESMIYNILSGYCQKHKEEKHL